MSTKSNLTYSLDGSHETASGNRKLALHWLAREEEKGKTKGKDDRERKGKNLKERISRRLKISLFFNFKLKYTKKNMSRQRNAS